jgi:hypothetical protein
MGTVEALLWRRLRMYISQIRGELWIERSLFLGKSWANGNIVYKHGLLRRPGGD